MSIVEWSSLGGIALVLIAIIGLFYKLGKTEQVFSSNVEATNALRLDIKEHIANLNIHVNPETERRGYEERKEFQKEMKEKLDTITKEVIRK